MTRKRTKSLWWTGLSSILVVVALGLEADAQVLDADCFSGGCGGSKGIPECPHGFEEVGFVLYANSRADEAESCETVVSCTNLGRKTVEVNCRFYHGFYPIPAGGSRRDALCHSETPDVAPGDTTECATDATDEPSFQAGGIFLAGDAQCPPFEGKGLVCVKGGKADDVVCEAHLVCNAGATLENINVVSKKRTKSKKD